MDDLNIQNPGDWLFDTRYICTCNKCDKRYFGPKRSNTCWEHTSESFKESWVASFQEPKNPPLEPSEMIFPFTRFTSSGQ